MLIEFLTKTADIVGLAGVTMLLAAYYLLTTNRLSSQSLRYQLCNFIGSAAILYSLLFKFNLSACVIEIAWMIVSLIGISRILKKRYKSNN